MAWTTYPTVSDGTPTHNARALTDAEAANFVGVNMADLNEGSANVPNQCDAKYKVWPIQAFLLWAKARLLGIAPITPAALVYAAALTPDCADGLYRSIVCTGDLTLHPPASPVDGLRWRGRLSASGADRALTLDGAIVIPSDSAFVSPKTLLSGKTYLMQLEYVGAAWVLQSFVGGY